jgi:hypothetical protein
MQKPHVPEFLRPRLRLFFGVDLVGSTSFKQKGEYPLKNPSEAEFRHLGAKWFSGIANFYRDVERRFSVAWADCRKAYFETTGTELGIQPKLWKTNGDELIYEVALTEAEDVAYILAAWITALKAYRRDLKIQLGHDLDIKATAWLAGFPIGNAEVVFCSDVSANIKRYQDEDPKVFHFSLLELWYENESNRSGLVKDYVGPAVDTGFRIATHSTPRKFVISLEVALILSLAGPLQQFCKKYSFDQEGLTVAFDGCHAMKGVLGGRPYPIFWIDLMFDDHLTRSFDKISPANKPEQKHTTDYIQSFIDDNKEYLFHPFIDGCKNQHFKVMPENYDSTMHRLSSRWAEEKERLNIRWESFASDSHPNDSGKNIVSSVPEGVSVDIFK